MNRESLYIIVAHIPLAVVGGLSVCALMAGRADWFAPLYWALGGAIIWYIAFSAAAIVAATKTK